MRQISPVGSPHVRPPARRVHPADLRKRRLAELRDQRSGPLRPRLRRRGVLRCRDRRSYADRSEAAFATRVVVRRPQAGGSGTLVVEWLNVSSGQDAAPDWTYLAEEIVRRGHTWAGVSAQRVGVEGGAAAGPDRRRGAGAEGGGPGAVRRPRAPRRRLRLRRLHAGRPRPGRRPRGDVRAGRGRVAVGVRARRPTSTSCTSGPGSSTGSSCTAAAPARCTPTSRRPIRTDHAAPVLVVQTEGDLFGRLGFLPARQPDAERFRLWEIAGAAHADLFQIGGFESFLDCPDPVNRGQQAYVVRAALRRLEAWARGGVAAPGAPRLEVDGDGVRARRGGQRARRRTHAGRRRARGRAVRLRRPRARRRSAQLFGRTLPLDPAQPGLYASHEEYLAAYSGRHRRRDRRRLRAARGPRRRAGRGPSRPALG